MKVTLVMTFAVAMFISTTEGHRLNQASKHRLVQRNKNGGIFDKMIEMATSGDKANEEKHNAS